MCGSMVDIQSATDEIRRGKKEDRKKEETTGQKYNVRIRMITDLLYHRAEYAEDGTLLQFDVFVRHTFEP